jgi:hypothetical protein
VTGCLNTGWTAADDTAQVRTVAGTVGAGSASIGEYITSVLDIDINVPIGWMH